jgi:hypothetical protein
VTIYNKKVYVVFFLRLLKCAVLDQLTVDRRGVSRGRYVDVDVGCLHFKGTSTALLGHFNSKKKCIVAAICIKRFSVSRMRDYSSYSSIVIQKSL